MARVKLGDVAREYKATNKDAAGLPSVGLEHLTLGEITLESWDEGAETTFTKAFKKGQMLFGRRRAYLKKAALAPFDGICSGDITVIEAIPGKILPELLPFIIQNDMLFDYAVGKSAGSLSPRVKWVDLKDYEFELPEITAQGRLVELLQAAYASKKAYQNLLKTTDEMVKSQFIERFENKGYDIVKAGTVMKDMRNGLSPSTSGTCHGKVLTLTAFTQGMFDDTQWKDATFAETPPESKRINESDFYMCRGNGNVKLVGKGVYAYHSNENLVFPDTVIAASTDTEKICLPYLFMAWQMPDVREQIEKGARTTNGTYKINQKIISDIKLILPPLSEQNKFVKLLKQADKSKFELKQAIEKVDNLIKSLIQ